MSVLAAVERATIDRLAGVHGGPSVVFVNGAFDPYLSDIDPPLPGVTLAPMPTSPSDLETIADTPSGRVSPDSSGGAVVAVADGARVDRPIHVVHVRDPSSPGGHDAHSAIHLGRGSRAQVIESYVHVGDPADSQTTTRVVVGADAELRLLRIVGADPDSTHTGRTLVRLEASSTLRSTSVILDGARVTSDVEVVLAGEGARFDADGLHAPTGRQTHEHALVVDHAAPNCTSVQRYRGIVDDHAHGVFASHVIVRPGADGTDSVQSNPNLVLSSTAEADTRPWLEILADDVSCAHGATVGRLDDDALFYLRSRGIPVAEARAVLIEAFASEIIGGIQPDSLRDLVAAGLDRAWMGALR